MPPFPASFFPHPQGLYLAFAVGYPLVLATDLFGAPPSPALARRKTVAYAALALAFAAALALGAGPSGREQAEQFLAAYSVEMALSVDNLFVFLLLFQSFGTSKPAQRKVLLAGIGGALVLRAAFIGAGLAALHRLHQLIYAFGGLLVAMGLKLLWPHAPPQAAAPLPWAARVAQRLLPLCSAQEAAAQPTAFVVRTPRGRRATPLLLLLVAIEASDVLFAVDSVPAGFAIVGDGWLLFCANAFAVLGLRALYVTLDGALLRMRFLRPALACVLVLVGMKMLLASIVEVPAAYSLAAIAAVLGLAAWASARWPDPGLAVDGQKRA